MTNINHPPTDAIALLKELRDTTPMVAQRKRIDAFFESRDASPDEGNPSAPLSPSEIRYNCCYCQDTKAILIEGDIEANPCPKCSAPPTHQPVEKRLLSDLEYFVSSIQGGYAVALEELERGKDARQFIKNQAAIDWISSGLNLLRPYLRPPKREASVEEALRSELAAYKAVYAQAIKLSCLMGEVPQDDAGQNDRVFAHFEFDELRYAFTLVDALKGVATAQIEDGETNDMR